MRTVTRWKPAALGVTALLALAMLSGCVPTPAHTSTPTPQATPLFATDAEALAAATKAYAAYLKMSDTIAHDGGAHPERIKAVATGDALRDLTSDISEYTELHWHTTGSTKFDSMKLQSRAHGSHEELTIYVCEDVSDIDVLDANGTSQVKKNRDARTPFDAVLTEVDGRLLLSAKSLWSGMDFCS